MTKATHPPIGMVDLFGAQAEHRQHTVELLQRCFQAAGYGPVNTPVLERAEHFIDRIGEDMRRRLYLFTEPGGREICLRPEFTIPTVRLYADQHTTAETFRGSYCGPVFRYGADDAATHRQFTQAGVELIGPIDPQEGDVEILKLAVEAVKAIGHLAQPIRVNDLSFYHSLLDAADLSPKWHGRLATLARNPLRLRQFLDAQPTPDQAADGALPAPAERWQFLETLQALEPSDRHGVVEGMVRSLQPDSHFGTRTVEDIVARTLEQADLADRNRLPGALAESLLRLTSVTGPISEALDTIDAIAQDAPSPELAEIVDQWRQRQAMLVEAGIEQNTLTLDLTIGRGLDYYTGLLFEIGTEPLAAGGRYDRLVADLSGSLDTRAVGFAVNLDAIPDSQEGPTP